MFLPVLHRFMCCSICFSMSSTPLSVDEYCHACAFCDDCVLYHYRCLYCWDSCTYSWTGHFQTFSCLCLILPISDLLFPILSFRFLICGLMSSCLFAIIHNCSRITHHVVLMSHCVFAHTLAFLSYVGSYFQDPAIRISDFSSVSMCMLISLNIPNTHFGCMCIHLIHLDFNVVNLLLSRMCAWLKLNSCLLRVDFSLL